MFICSIKKLQYLIFSIGCLISSGNSEHGFVAHFTIGHCSLLIDLQFVIVLRVRFIFLH